jgi:CrcB protein
MSWPVWIGVAMLGGCGALARFGLTLLVADRLHPHLPVGTLAVNVSGAFLLGLLAGASVEGDARLLLGAGLIGSYTTFSTWMLETDRIEEAGRRRLALLNVLLSIVLGVAAAALGRQLATHL